MTPLRILSALALASALALPLGAQEVRVVGDDDSPAARLVHEILQRNRYLRIDRDTILPADFHTPGDLVIYDAEVRLEGTVEGSVAVIGGHLFIRPRSRVAGPIAVLGGEVYPSSLATTGEVLRATPGSRLVLRADSLTLVDTSTTVLTAQLIAPQPGRLLSLKPALPSYDRVNGLTVAVGATVLPARNDSGPRVDAWVAYRGENPDHLGGGVRLDVPLGVQGVRVVGEASRATRTNDAWMRGDLSNSISVATTGRDFRNYYDADRVAVMLTRPLNTPLLAGRSWLGPRIGAAWSQDRSLPDHDVWSVLDNERNLRVNPPILEGTIVSALAGAEVHWRGRLSSFTGDVQVEHALAGASDAEFTQVVGVGRYRTMAFGTHTLMVHFRGMAPVGGNDAPPQRYGILGGVGSLPTLRVGTFRGDHLAFIESVYSVPVPAVELPFIGMPRFELLYATGAAWVGGDVPRWVQNPGVGLAFSFVTVRVVADPAADPIKPKVVFMVSVPQM
ncbi:MAG TPA: hypothetical protein VEW03_04350 [Longimicrobiaceae bacterium]|nr:hypothetical protein [Longimicrobiaceae bacterium]